MRKNNWNATTTDNRNKLVKNIHATCVSELPCNLPFSFTIINESDSVRRGGEGALQAPSDADEEADD